MSFPHHLYDLQHQPSVASPAQRRFAPSALEPSAGGGLMNVAIGPLLQCLEAASLGMPFEVWKTRMGRFRSEGPVEAFKAVYARGGARAFWSGLDAKMVESASKGAVLMYSKETLNASLLSTGTDPVLAGLLAGAGGGVCQVAVMGPCTFLVTSKVVSSGEPQSTLSRIQSTYAQKGVKGFYPGGTALAFRQATNWASRQGFTEAVRGQMKARLHPDALPQTVKLSKLEEVAAGTVGGVLACWNHPFEVARIEAQSRAAQGQSALSMVEVMQLVVKENGLKGLFTGLTPRVMLGIWQTLFMVTGAKIVKDALDVK